MLYESMYDSMSPIIVHYTAAGGRRIPSVTAEDEDVDNPEEGLPVDNNI